MHLGAYMKGGTIDVSGNVTDWLGAEMSGGFIRVRGNAGGQVGAAYRGSPSGMTDGTIIVDGTAGLEVGMRMKRGIIVIGGAVRDFAGLQMKGGTIVLRGGAELRTGAWMMRGTIVSLKPLPLLPTFAAAATYNPTFLRMYARHLRPWVSRSRTKRATAPISAIRATPAFRARERSSSGALTGGRVKNPVQDVLVPPTLRRDSHTVPVGQPHSLHIPGRHLQRRDLLLIHLGELPFTDTTIALVGTRGDEDKPLYRRHLSRSASDAA